MKLLLDTNVLLWTAAGLSRVPTEIIDMIRSADNEISFSVVSLWEVVIKQALNRPDFQIDPLNLRLRLIDNGFREIDVTAEHVLAVGQLPALHRDPFDRLLIAQARAERMTLLTGDDMIVRYAGDIRKV